MRDKTEQAVAKPIAEPAGAAMPKSRFELPWIILLAMLLAIVLAAHQSQQRADKDAQARFGDIVDHVANRLRDDIRHIESAMALAGAVVAASPNVNHHNLINNRQWNAFLDGHIRRTEPVRGLVRLEFRPTPQDNHALPAFAASPRLVRNFESGVPFIEELSASGLISAAIGVAKKTQKSVLTSALVRHEGSKATEFVALVKPVYSPFIANDAPVGYVVAVVRPAGLLAAAASGGHRLALAIAENQTMLFDSARGAAAGTNLRSSTALPVAQREWTLIAAATPKLAEELSSKAPAAILIVGVLGTLSLVGLVWLLTRLRDQATALADSMTVKLRDHVKFTDDLIELNPNPIYRKDAHGHLVAVNRAWEHLHMRNRLDVIGRRSHDFQEAAIGEADEKFDADVLASSAGFEAREAVVMDAAGNVVPTIVAKQVIRRADGTVDGIIGTVTDVTLIKQLEREVARQREQLDLVIRSSQQGIFDVEFDATDNQYYSERFREILGFGDNNFPPLFSLQDWVFADDRELFHAHLVEHLKRLVPYFDIECRACRAGGGHMWLRVRGIAQFDEHGRGKRFVGSIVDVTERREAELKLIDANLRVMVAARAKEAFLATMSHEIRTPMNGVLGMASLLADTELNDEQRDYIRLIRASGDTLLRLINDVLDFSKIESGHMTLESVSVELVGVVEETFELAAEKARQKKLELVWDLPDDLPDYFVGDATRFRQILLNLLTNAIKFTDQGEITLTMRVEDTPDGNLKLTTSVHDTGIGIPAGRIQQLFEPFTQVDASTTRKYGGTGLGLAIVKRLVSLMGGEVSLQSVEGEGSVFSFSIITSRADGPLRLHLQTGVPEFSAVRLLLLEGNPRRRQALARVCQRWGFDVMAVSPIEAAADMDAVGLRQTAILLTDTLLPSNEFRVLQSAIAAEDRRRTADGTPPLMVVLMSGLTRAELAQLSAFVPLRHDMLVVRPASRVRMFEVVRQAVSRPVAGDVATRPFSPKPVYDGDVAPPAANASNRSARPVESPGSPASAVGATDALDAVKILVAEDNEVNQRVIEGMLRRLGHRAVIVADGQAAVDAMRDEQQRAANHFELVLMDIHMPVLDGLAAMKAIRRGFAETKRAPIPIVAMTAHALAGDREHYLNEGMDDYISKPIRREELAALLARILSSRGEDKSQPSSRAVTANRAATPIPIPTGETTPILDLEQLEDMLGLSADDAADSSENELFTLFVTQSRMRLQTMTQSQAEGNWLQIGDVAHSFRGAAASIGFVRVAAACKVLEQAARRLAPKEGVPPAAVTGAPPGPAEMQMMVERVAGDFAEAMAAYDAWLALQK